MEEETNYKFEPHVWIAFEYDKQNCIGRTLIGVNNEKIIAVVSVLGNIGYVLFNEIKNPVKLNFLNKDEVKILENKKSKLIEPKLDNIQLRNKNIFFINILNG